MLPLYAYALMRTFPCLLPAARKSRAGNAFPASTDRATACRGAYAYAELPAAPHTPDRRTAHAAR